MKKRQKISTDRQKQLDELISRIGVPFRNINLLDEATTHKSFAGENDAQDYERLEFFGDAVLKFVVAEYLFDAYQAMHEGELTEIAAVLISAKTLEQVGRSIDIEPYIRVGRGVDIRGSIIARVMEAILGALYQDSKFKYVREFIVDKFCSMAEEVANDSVKENYKAQLQQYSQARAQGTPVYSVIKVDGPPHDPIFTIGVAIAEQMVADGAGPSKKAAEQAAAKAAFEKLTGGGGTAADNIKPSGKK
jgi:ribonuclease-3